MADTQMIPPSVGTQPQIVQQPPTVATTGGNTATPAQAAQRALAPQGVGVMQEQNTTINADQIPVRGQLAQAANGQPRQMDDLQPEQPAPTAVYSAEEQADLASIGG